jgi:glycosyltransferase involved in cell wall biosynthesis
MLPVISSTNGLADNEPADNTSPRLPITALILTFNEELNLEACLQSLAGWTKSIWIVDSLSTDRTFEIAKRNGAIVIEHQFESHQKQWKWALEQIPGLEDWILALDADQRITPELRNELGDLFKSGEGPDAHGLYIKRRQIFRGTWIKHGGYYPKYLLKLFRRSRVSFDELDLVDHHFYIAGPTAKLKHDLIEDNVKENDITFWVDKHTRYAARMAEEEMRRRENGRKTPIAPRFFGTPDQRSLWMKSLWSRCPLYVRPVLYFHYRYFLQKGFLDGKQGFIFHFVQGFWFRLLVDIKIEEMTKGLVVPRSRSRA